MNNRRNIGRLYAVGVGPGDPELITMKAYRTLRNCTVVFVPQKNTKSDSFAKSIISDFIDHSKQQIISLIFPMVRDKDFLAAYWAEAADTIWQHLKKDGDCAFVNVGDPLLYGSFIHVFDTLKNKYPEVEIEVIPGISSINAVAAKAMIPLAVDDEQVAIISDSCEESKIREALETFDTVIFMKVSSIFDRLLPILKENNLVKKSVYIRRCTTPDEEIVRDINELTGKRLDYFSLLIVRK